MDVSDSALLATLLREAPIGFAFFGTDLCFRRVNRISQAAKGFLPQAERKTKPAISRRISSA